MVCFLTKNLLAVTANVNGALIQKFHVCVILFPIWVFFPRLWQLTQQHGKEGDHPYFHSRRNIPKFIWSFASGMATFYF